MLLGATTQEAFVPFIHFRVLASNLMACHPNQNPSRYTALPDSYVGLYELYETKLIGHLRESKRLCDAPDSRTLSSATQSVSDKMRKAIEYLVISPMDSNDMEFLPSEGELSTFLMSPMSRQLSERAVRTGTVADEVCDAGLDPREYFSHPLEGASKPYENCCSYACRAILSVSSMLVTSMDCCCKGCNRHYCSENSGTKVEAVASAAEVYSVVKEDMTPCIYTFVI